MQRNPPQQPPKHAPKQLQQLGLREIGFVCQKTLSRHSRRNSPGKSRRVSASMAAIMFPTLPESPVDLAKDQSGPKVNIFSVMRGHNGCSLPGGPGRERRSFG